MTGKIRKDRKSHGRKLLFNATEPDFELEIARYTKKEIRLLSF